MNQTRSDFSAEAEEAGEMAMKVPDMAMRVAVISAAKLVLRVGSTAVRVAGAVVDTSRPDGRSSFLANVFANGDRVLRRSRPV